MPRSRVAVTRGSFCRSEPAAALRGLANTGLPASVIDTLSRSNASVGRNTSPRTSTSAGHGELVAPGQPVWHRVDRLDVGGDVLAGAPVAAGQRPHQPALLVQQVDGQPVDLELAQQVGVLHAVALEPGVPGLELLVAERVVEALHRPEVVDRREVGRDRAADLLRRRVGRAQLGPLLLERLQPPQPDVVVGVGQRRVVEHEVAPAGVLDLLDDLLVLGPRLCGSRLRRSSLTRDILPASTDIRSVRSTAPNTVRDRDPRHQPGRAALDAVRRVRPAAGPDPDAARRQGPRARGRGRPQPVVAPYGGDAARHRPTLPRRPASAPGCCASPTAAGTAVPPASPTRAPGWTTYAVSSATSPSSCSATRWAAAPPSTSPTTPASAASSPSPPGSRPGESVEALRGKQLYAAHGSRDRITSARATAAYVRRAAEVARTAEFHDMGPVGHYLLRGRRAWNEFAIESALRVLEKLPEETFDETELFHRSRWLYGLTKRNRFVSSV